MEGRRLRSLAGLTTVTVTKAGLDQGTLSGMKDVSGWVVFLRGSEVGGRGSRLTRHCSTRQEPRLGLWSQLHPTLLCDLNCSRPPLLHQ